MNLCQRVADIQVTAASSQIRRGQQNLSGVPTVAGQRSLVGLNQIGLPDRRNGLQLRQAAGPLGQIQFADAGSDRSAADHDDLAAGVGDVGQTGRKPIDTRQIQLSVGRRQDSSANLDDDTGGRVDALPALFQFAVVGQVGKGQIKGRTSS